MAGPTTAEQGTTGRAKAKARAKAASELDQPNILIVLWDTVRADRLSIYGNTRSSTPFLERLAKTSLIFERAISPAMRTVLPTAVCLRGLPSVSMAPPSLNIDSLTGRYETMAERFSKSGYQTYAFSANPNLNQRSIGLLQGFDTIEQSWSKELGSISAEVTQKKLIARDQSTEIFT